MGRLLLVVGVSVLFFPACEDRDSEGRRRSVIAWQPAPLGGQQLLGDVGLDCSAGGAPSCRTEICLHVSEFHDRGYFCSASCRKEENCPVGWICGPIIAGMTDRVCVPPSDWDGGTAPISEPLILPPPPRPSLIQALADGGAQ